MHRFVSLFALTLLLIGFAACDSGGANDDDNGLGNGNGNGDDTFVLEDGTFSVTIVQDTMTALATGGAVFGFATDVDDISPGNQEGLVILMLSGDRAGGLTDEYTEIHLIDAGRTELPEAGEHDFRNDLSTTALDGLSMIGGGEGSYSLSSVTADEISGEFSFEAPNGSISAVGSFWAERAEDIDTALCAPDCD